MSTLSIDIGMKNFAYCIIDDDFKIKEWNVLDIGKSPLNMLKSIDKLDLQSKCQKVVLEKQPTKNVKMKQLENMLHAYFIIKGHMNTDSNISYIDIFNPKNKLGSSHVKGAKNYRERKKISVELCNLFLSFQNNQDSAFIHKFKNSKKKDDLSDCLLQGIVYMKFDIERLCNNVIIKTNIKPRKPTDKQIKTGYSKSNLKYIFNTTNTNKEEISKDSNIKKAIMQHYNGSIDSAWKDLYNFDNL